MTGAAHLPPAPVGRQGPPTRVAAPAAKTRRAARGSLLSTTGTDPSRLTPTQNAEISRMNLTAPADPATLVAIDRNRWSGPSE